ncbi:hypothetical protein GCM10027615_37750 [Plantactinospora veratri]
MRRRDRPYRSGRLASDRGGGAHTESGRLGIALNSMLDRIESEVAAPTASEQRLRQFLADASHELRTPLTSIRGFAELYRRGGAPPGRLLDETLSRIEREAARMGLLVEDMLLLARLDRQREPQRRPVDMLAIAADTIRDAHARRPDRPVRLASFGGDQLWAPAAVEPSPRPRARSPPCSPPPGGTQRLDGERRVRYLRHRHRDPRAGRVWEFVDGVRSHRALPHRITAAARYP